MLRIRSSHLIRRSGMLSVIVLVFILFFSGIGAQEPDDSVLGVVSGRVVQGTRDASLPQNLTVTLHILDALLNEQTMETVTDAEGRFTFADVPVAAVNTYFVSVTYANFAFASPPAQMTPGGNGLDLPIVIYETTNDPEVISIVGISTQIEYPPNMADFLQMTQMMRFRNTSDNLYTGEGVLTTGQPISLVVPLPVGAVVVELENTERIFIDESSFSLIDTRPVLPGNEHFIYVVYLIPYSESAIVDYPVRYALDGPVHVQVGIDAMLFHSDQITYLGTETLEDREIETYGGTVQLMADEAILFTLSGDTALSPAGDAGTSSSGAAIFFVGVLAGLAVVVIGLLFLGRGNKSLDIKQAEIDALLRQLDVLERAHDAGEINHDVFQRRRIELREQIDALMAGDDSTETMGNIE